MNGYLVLLRHSMEDLPAGLHETREAALAQAKILDAMPNGNVRDVFNTDCSTPVCISLVQFSNGVPVACEVVRDFEREEVDASS